MDAEFFDKDILTNDDYIKLLEAKIIILEQENKRLIKELERKNNEK